MSLKDRARCLFRLPAPSTGSVDDFEYPNLFGHSGRSIHETVAKWKDTAAIGYQTIDRIHRSGVEELRWYKNAEGLKQEYMVATCRRAGEVDVYLRLECAPKIPNFNFVRPLQTLPADMTEKFTKEQLNSFRADVEAATVRKLVTKRKNNSRAADSVTRVGNDEGFLGEPTRLVASYQNFQRPFYVRDLAFLACAISEHNPDHRFFIPRCYWYARALVDAAVAIYQPTTITAGDGFKAAGTYTVGKRLRPGLENTVQVYVSNDPQEVERIKSTFLDSIALHDLRVSPTSLNQHTPRFEQPDPGSRPSPTPPSTSRFLSLDPEVDAMVGSFLQRLPTGPNTINITILNVGSGNITGNTHTNVNNIAFRGGHQDAQEHTIPMLNVTGGPSSEP